MSKHVYSLPQYIEQWSFCLRKMYIKNSLSIQLRHSLVVSGCPLHFARILSSVNFGSKCLQVHYIPGGRSWHCRYVAWHKSQALPSPRQPALKQHPRHPKHRRRRRPPRTPLAKTPQRPELPRAECSPVPTHAFFPERRARTGRTVHFSDESDPSSPKTEASSPDCQVPTPSLAPWKAGPVLLGRAHLQVPSTSGELEPMDAAHAAREAFLARQARRSSRTHDFVV